MPGIHGSRLEYTLSYGNIKMNEQPVKCFNLHKCFLWY